MFSQRKTYMLEDNPLLAVRDYLFGIVAGRLLNPQTWKRPNLAWKHYEEYCKTGSKQMFW